MKICTLNNCENKHYAKGFCRSHYRITFKEQHKRWLNIKSDPVRHGKYLAYMRVKHKDYAIDYKKHADKVYFNGNREVAIQRDNERCAICHLSRSDHREKYRVDLNVHHIDGNGHGVKKEKRNMELENLLTVCQSCHARVHYRQNHE